MTEARFQPKGIVPTDEQLAIQLERRKHVIIEANAGAAKTTTLALRLAQALTRGADVERIVALTYTDAAVLALRQTLERLGVPAATRKRIRIHTFDAFCAARLLGTEGAAVPRLDTPEQLQPHVLLAIDRMLSNLDERYRDEFAIEGSGQAIVEGLLASFARLKGTMQLTFDAAERSLTPSLADELGHDYVTLRAFRVYEHLRRGGHPDHHAFRAPHDATYDLATLLLDEDALVDLTHPLAMGLHLVLVDEMHDTNRAMFTVLRHLLRHNPQAAFVGVGDRDQVIHAVAGADADFMGATFDREMGPAHRYPLSASYRFGPALALAASQLAKKACLSRSVLPTEVVLQACSTPREASHSIVQAIQTRVGLTPTASTAEIAVLLRQPHQSVELENHLLDKGVPYRTAGFDSYLMRPEVLFVRGLYAHARQAFASIDSRDTRTRILQAMLVFCGSHVECASDDPTERQRLAQQAIDEVAANPQLAPYFVDNQVLRHASGVARQHVQAAISLIQANDTDALLQGFANALQPHVLAARVMVRAADIEQVTANVKGLIASAQGYTHIDSFFNEMNNRELRLQAMRNQHSIVLSSIEAAKGLEFEHVIMPGLNKGEFALGGNTRDNRNLLYVGMTRAKRRLTILFDPARPSHYLHDAGLL